MSPTFRLKTTAHKRSSCVSLAACDCTHRRPNPENPISLLLSPHNGCSIMKGNHAQKMLRSSLAQEGYRLSAKTRKQEDTRALQTTAMEQQRDHWGTGMSRAH